MVFPVTAVPAVVEIAPGGDPAASDGTWSWTDITTAVRLQDRISIVHGRQNEASLIDPSRCTMNLDNSSGDFTPRNPYGQWYGQLGRNTPLRVRILRGQDLFARTTSNGWGTADSGQAWTTGGTAAADFSVSGGVGKHSHATVNNLRRTTLATSLLDCEQMYDVATSALLTGAALVTGFLFRYQDDNNYYWLRAEFNAGGTTVMLKISKCVAGGFTDLGVLDPVPGLAYAADTFLRVRASVVGNRLAIKVWPVGGTEPTGWQVTATDDTFTTAGATGIQSWLVLGNTNTLPVVASFDNYTAHVDRFSGFVSSWPPRWDVTGNDATVPIQADGVLRRLSQGSPPARSALRRTIAAAGPVAYWPGEDGAAATQLASAFPGHPAMIVTGSAEFVQAADVVNVAGTGVTLRPGTAALVNLAGGAELSASVPGEVTAATATAWTVHVRADVDPAAISGDVVVAEWTTPGGTYVRWQLVYGALDTQVIGYTASGSSTVLVTGSLIAGLSAYAVSAQQVGGNIQITYWPNSPVSVAGTLAGVASLTSNPTNTTATAPLIVGHVAIWASVAQPYSWDDVETDAYGVTIYSVGLSARLEAANLRLARLCAEDGVQLNIPAVDLAAVARMGWQPVNTPLALYRECEATDQGVLHELGFGLGYVPRDYRYNRPTALTLDVNAGQVAPPLEPVDDDYLLRNRVTVRRIDGSEATAQNANSVASVGPYESSVDVSIGVDSQLPDHASWLVHVRSTPVMRWQNINVNLARSPELVDAVLSARVQSRVAVDNPPVQAVGDDIDVLIEGYTETIGYTDWMVGFNTSPAAVWDVATVDGEQRVAADGSVLAADLTAGGTSMLLLSTAENGPWTEDPSEMPLDMRVGGERVTASALAAVALDTFGGRTVASGWGLPASGGAWTTSGGAASDYSVGSGVGNQSQGTVNVLRTALMDVGVTDATVVTDVTVPVLPTGGSITHWSVARAADLSNYYTVRLTITTSGSTSIALVKRVAGSLSGNLANVTLSGTHTAGTLWRVVLDVRGTLLRAKAWRLASDSEPDWLVSATDSDLTAGTKAGVLSRLETGNTNALPVVIAYDYFAVPNPQVVTLSARAVNGVSRSWPAGTEVDVWFPAIVGL